MKIRALRGAIDVASDTKEEVLEATAALLREMFARNEIDHNDLVDIFFTATPDLTSEFPAAAARGIGISDVPLLCATEIGVVGAMPKVIRVLMHFYTDRDNAALRHVYMGETRSLRDDLPG